MKALILIDLQNDFMPSGTLPVAQGFSAVEAANKAMPFFTEVIATKDWHPHNHLGFISQHPDQKPFDTIKLGDVEQVLWPDHCIQDTFGAEFVESLEQEKISFVVKKGQKREIDSYSGFFDNARKKETELRSYLLAKNITDVYILGVATDFCVKFTALDAQQLGFKTHVIIDGCRGIAVDQSTQEKTNSELVDNGVKIVYMNSLSSLAGYP